MTSRTKILQQLYMASQSGLAQVDEKVLLDHLKLAFEADTIEEVICHIVMLSRKDDEWMPTLENIHRSIELLQKVRMPS